MGARSHGFPSVTKRGCSYVESGSIHQILRNVARATVSAAALSLASPAKQFDTARIQVAHRRILERWHLTRHRTHSSDMRSHMHKRESKLCCFRIIGNTGMLCVCFYFRQFYQEFSL
jgi:hypothetical protein